MKSAKWSCLATALLLGCVIALTPEQKREQGLSALNAAESAEDAIIVAVDYDCPEVFDAAVKKLSTKEGIDGLILCGAGAADAQSLADKGNYFNKPQWICNEVYPARQQRINRFIKEEERKLLHSKGVTSQEIAERKELQVMTTARKIGETILAEKPDAFSAPQITRMFEGWNLDANAKMKLMANCNQDLVHSVFAEMIGPKPPNATEPDFATVLETYKKFENPTNKEFAELVERAVASYSTWKQNESIKQSVGAELLKAKKKTAHAYLSATRGISGLDRDGAFAEAYFDEDIWAEAYIAAGLKQSEYDYVMASRNAEYRKQLAKHVTNKALIKKMLMSVTGFNASKEDIGVRDNIARLDNDVDVADVAQRALDEDVRQIALSYVKDFKTIADSIKTEKDIVTKVRKARTLAQLIAAKKDASANDKQLGVEMSGIIKTYAEQILASSKSKESNVFVLKGFYPGMTCDDAEILLGWYYPDAEVLQKVNTNTDFFGNPGLNHGERYITIDGRKFCDVRKDGTVRRIDFSAKMLFDWLGFEDSNQIAWVEKFRKKFNLPEFTCHIEQKDFTIMGVHKIETVGTYFYRHPNGWKITHYGEKHHSAHGDVGGERQHMNRYAAGGNLCVELN